MQIGSAVQAFARDNPYPIGTSGNIATTTTYGVVELDSDTGFTSWGGTKAIVVNGNGSGTAIAEGISRGDGINPPYFAPGTLSIGTKAQDTTVTIGSVTNTNSSLLGGQINLTSGNLSTTGGNVSIEALSPTGDGATVSISAVSTGTGTTLIDIETGFGTTNSIQMGASRANNITIGNSSANTALYGDIITINANGSGLQTIQVGTDTSNCAVAVQGTVNLGDTSNDGTLVQVYSPTLAVGSNSNSYNTHLLDLSPSTGGPSVSTGLSGASIVAIAAPLTDTSGYFYINTTSATVISSLSSVTLFQINFGRAYAHPPVILYTVGLATGNNPSGLTINPNLNIFLTGGSDSLFNVQCANTTGGSISLPATNGSIGAGYIFSYFVIGR